MTTAVDNQPVAARLGGGRCDGLVTHSSYTTRGDTTGGATKAAVCRTFGIKRSTLLDTLARIGWQGPGRAGTRGDEA